MAKESRWHRTEYLMRDIGKKDEVTMTRQGFCLTHGNTDSYMRFANLFEYAGWLHRNASRLPVWSEREWRRFAKELSQFLESQGGMS